MSSGHAVKKSTAPAIFVHWLRGTCINEKQVFLDVCHTVKETSLNASCCRAKFCERWMNGRFALTCPTCIDWVWRHQQKRDQKNWSESSRQHTHHALLTFGFDDLNEEMIASAKSILIDYLPCDTKGLSTFDEDRHSGYHKSKVVDLIFLLAHHLR